MPETHFTEPDPTDDIDLVGDDSVVSGLDLLRKAASTEVDAPQVFPIRTMPGWALRCRVNVTVPELRDWGKKATSKRTKELDPLLEARLILANTTLAILHDGKPILGRDGDPVTFGSEDFRDQVGVNGGAPVVDGIAQFIKNDGDTCALALAVQFASGFGQIVNPEDEPDPTRRGT